MVEDNITPDPEVKAVLEDLEMDIQADIPLVPTSSVAVLLGELQRLRLVEVRRESEVWNRVNDLVDEERDAFENEHLAYERVLDQLYDAVSVLAPSDAEAQRELGHARRLVEEFYQTNPVKRLQEHKAEIWDDAYAQGIQDEVDAAGMNHEYAPARVNPYRNIKPVHTYTSAPAFNKPEPSA